VSDEKISTPGWEREDISIIGILLVIKNLYDCASQ